MKRVAASIGLCLEWFVLVGVGGLLAGHDKDLGGVFLVVVILTGPVLGLYLLVLATEDADLRFVIVLVWIAWLGAGILGVGAMGVAGEAYQSSFGRPQAVTVMDARCLPHSDSGDCDPQARASTVDSERDLGWAVDCPPRHRPGQRAVVLTDPRGWFQPHMDTCAGDGRGSGLFLLGSACFVVVLTLAQLVWVVLDY